MSIWEKVRDHWNGPTAYYLLLITRHQDGIWGFSQFLSHAHDALRAADPSTPAAEEMLFPFEDEWVMVICQNLRRLVAEGRRFSIIERLAEVFGETLGLAREMHLRKALYQLFHEGLIVRQPTGRLQRS